MLDIVLKAHESYKMNILYILKAQNMLFGS